MQNLFEINLWHPQILIFGAVAYVGFRMVLIVHRLSLSRDRDKARREMLAKASDVIDGLIDKLLESGSAITQKRETFLRKKQNKNSTKKTLETESLP